MGIKIEVPALDAGLLRHLVEVVEVQSKLLRQPGRGVGIGLVFLQVHGGGLHQDEPDALLPAEGDYPHKIVQGLFAYLRRGLYGPGVFHIEIPMAVEGIAALVVYQLPGPGEVLKIFLRQLAVSLVIQRQAQQQ